MAGIYGSFLDKDHPLFPKFCSRVKALNNIAIHNLKETEKKHPNIVGLLAVSYVNIQLVVGKYYNDVVRLKALQDIEIVHRAKIVSHMIKWINLNPVIVSCVSKEQYDTLCREDKIALMNANYSFITCIIIYFLEECSSLFQDRNIEKATNLIGELHYYLKTGTYEEHVANLLFQHI